MVFDPNWPYHGRYTALIAQLIDNAVIDLNLLPLVSNRASVPNKEFRDELTRALEDTKPVDPATVFSALTKC